MWYTTGRSNRKEGTAPVGWRCRSTQRRGSPRHFICMSSAEIFIDESGDFGQFDKNCPYYIVTLVRHDSDAPIITHIGDLEYRLAMLGFEDLPIHTSPAIRGEDAYYGIDLKTRRKILSCFSFFMRKCPLSYKTIVIEKSPRMSTDDFSSAISKAIDDFLADAGGTLPSGEGKISVVYDRGQPQLAKILSDSFASRALPVRHFKSLPVYARLVQAADFACTIERIGMRLSSGAGFARPEMIFFGTERRFRKEWLLPLRKKAWS